MENLKRLRRIHEVGYRPVEDASTQAPAKHTQHRGTWVKTVSLEGPKTEGSPIKASQGCHARDCRPTRLGAIAPYGEMNRIRGRRGSP